MFTAEAVDRLVQYFEHLSPQGVPQLSAMYHSQARFVDPFNDVVGLSAIEGIFVHMFVALDAPRFVITARIVQGQQCFLTWDFHFRFRNFQKDTLQTIRGGSHLPGRAHRYTGAQAAGANPGGCRRRVGPLGTCCKRLMGRLGGPSRSTARRTEHNAASACDPPKPAGQGPQGGVRSGAFGRALLARHRCVNDAISWSVWQKAISKGQRPRIAARSKGRSADFNSHRKQKDKN